MYDEQLTPAEIAQLAPYKNEHGLYNIDLIWEGVYHTSPLNGAFNMFFGEEDAEDATPLILKARAANVAYLASLLEEWLDPTGRLLYRHDMDKEVKAKYPEIAPHLLAERDAQLRDRHNRWQQENPGLLHAYMLNDQEWQMRDQGGEFAGWKNDPTPGPQGDQYSDQAGIEENPGPL